MIRDAKIIGIAGATCCVVATLLARDPAMQIEGQAAGLLAPSVPIVRLVPNGTTENILTGAPGVPTPEAEYHEAIVYVQDHPPGSGGSAGSGTLITAHNAEHQPVTVCLTAGHVLSDRPRGPAYIVVRHGPRANTYYRCAIQVLDMSLDLAVIRPEPDPVAAGMRPLSIAAALPGKGEKVELCGYGAGRWRHNEADVLGYTTHNTQAKDNIGVDYRSISGDSGGGILNANHELVGVLWGGPGDYAGNVAATHGAHAQVISAVLASRLQLQAPCPTCPQPGGGSPTRPPTATPAPVRPPVAVPKPIPGPPGPKGDKGDPGEPCKCDPAKLASLEVTILDLKKQVEVLNQEINTLKQGKFTVDFLDAAGNAIEGSRQVVPLGGTLTLPAIPIEIVRPDGPDKRFAHPIDGKYVLRLQLNDVTPGSRAPGQQ